MFQTNISRGYNTMKLKILLLALTLILSMGVASAAYDVEVTSITPANQPIAGFQESVDIIVTNAGPDPITGEKITVTIDFDNGVTDVLSFTDLASGASTTLTSSTTWSKDATYSVVATLNGMSNDNNAANDKLASSITVNANSAPTIGTISSQSATVNTPFSLQISATDVDNHDLTYTLANQPSGMSIDTNGLITWTPSSFSQNTVSVTVSDTQDSASETFSISAGQPGAFLELSTTSIQLGSSNTQRGNQVTETFTVTNTGTETLNNVGATLQNNQGNALASSYNAQVSVSQNTLQTGESATISVIATIPNNIGSQVQSIGQISVTATSSSSIQIAKNLGLRMQAESKLEITDVELEVNGNDEGDLDDGDNYDDLKEGDEITLFITVDNTYSSSTTNEIENVYVEVEDDNDWDIDEESNEKDIDESDDYTFEVSFTLDENLDDDRTDVTVRVFGDDRVNGFEHYSEITFELEIDRDDDDISITSVNWDDATVQCEDSFATLNVRFRNAGTDDQDEAAILVQSDELDWHKRITNIELDEGDSETQEFQIPVRGIESGNYFVDIETFYDNSKRTDRETTSLRVVCDQNDEQEVPVTTPEPKPDTVVVTQPTPQPDYGEPVQAQVVDDNENYLIALGIIVLILLIAVIALAGKVLRK